MSNPLISLVSRQRNSGGAIPNTPFAAAPSPYFIEAGMNTQAFGPITTGPGLGLKDDTVMVDTQTLEGTIDSGLIV